MLYSISKFTDRVMYVKLKIDYMQLKQCILWLLCVDFFVQYKRSLPDVIFFPHPVRFQNFPQVPLCNSKCMADRAESTVLL